MEELQKLVMEYQNTEKQLQNFAMQKAQLESILLQLKRTEENLKVAKDDIFRMSGGFAYKVTKQEAEELIKKDIEKTQKSIELYKGQEEKLVKKIEDIKNRLQEEQNKMQKEE